MNVQHRTLTFDGRERVYYLHIPVDHDGSRPMPVVLAFHGATSNGRLMERFCGLNAKADKAGFIAVYPEGTGQTRNVLSWNGGSHYGYAAKHQVDDVGFVRALLDDLGTQVKVDESRVFAAGMSNGAQMVYRLAAELADRIAAIAAVAGPAALIDVPPSRPIPILHMHGTEDEFAPFNGGKGPRSMTGADFLSVEQTIQTWVRSNGCPETAKVDKLPSVVDDGTRIIRHTYGPCLHGAEVVLYVIEGGGHTWPGRPPWPEILGKSTSNLVANDVIWEFFQRHPKE